MNRLLAITRNTIPYVKEMRPYCGSVFACILMQQLEYWFDKYPNGFFKFLEPCEESGYNEGDSWTEELGCSPDEFRTAYDKIGTRYTSKTQFEASKDKFQGKMYCSYYDKIQKKTYYFRNHNMVDDILNSLISGGCPSPRAGNSQLQSWQNPSPELAKSIPNIYTDTTTENTTESAASAIAPAETKKVSKKKSTPSQQEIKEHKISTWQNYQPSNDELQLITQQNVSQGVYADDNTVMFDIKQIKWHLERCREYYIEHAAENTKTTTVIPKSAFAKWIARANLKPTGSKPNVSTDEQIYFATW